jgi:hypothetical protein
VAPFALHGVAQQLGSRGRRRCCRPAPGRWGVADEVFADQEGLGQAVGAGLHGVLQVQAPLAAVAQQLLKARRVLRRADDQDVADARQHQGAERVVDHRLVVHRQQLLADGQGGRVQAGAGAAGEDDAFALLCHGRSVQRISGSMRATPAASAAGQAEGGLQLAGVQARVVRAHGGRGEGAGGHGRDLFATILIAGCALLACSITNFA